MNIGKLIGNLITIGFVLASLGTLGEVTQALKKEAVASHKQGMFSLGDFNRKLIRGH